MISVTDAERRARLGRRHYLASPAAKVERATRALIGLHSSDPASVFLSARVRVKNFHIGDLERALYERRSLVRMLGMRRTMFVVDRDVGAVMDASCTQALAPAERRKLVQLVEHQGHASDGAKWLRRVEQLTMRALDELGAATATELSSVVPELKLKLTMGEGKKWGGDFGISTRVLFLLATEGRIVRTRPKGSWISSQYRWATTASRWTTRSSCFHASKSTTAPVTTPAPSPTVLRPPRGSSPPPPRSWCVCSVRSCSARSARSRSSDSAWPLPFSSTPPSCGSYWCTPRWNLLGDRNWWLPGWLDRILPRIHIEGRHDLDAELAALTEAESSPTAP